MSEVAGIASRGALVALQQNCLGGGLDSQSERGWRKALYCALSDGTNIKLGLKTKAKTKQKKLEQEEKLSLLIS